MFLIRHGGSLARTLVLVTGLVDRPIALRLDRDNGAVASLPVGSGSIEAAHGPFPLVVAEPSGLADA